MASTRCKSFAQVPLPQSLTEEERSAQQQLVREFLHATARSKNQSDRAYLIRVGQTTISRWERWAAGQVEWKDLKRATAQRMREALPKLLNPARKQSEREDDAARRRSRRRRHVARQIDEINKLKISEEHRTLRLAELAATYRASAMDRASGTARIEAAAARIRAQAMRDFARAARAAEQAAAERAVAAGKIPELPAPLTKLEPQEQGQQRRQG